MMPKLPAKRAYGVTQRPLELEKLPEFFSLGAGDLGSHSLLFGFNRAQGLFLEWFLF